MPDDTIYIFDPAAAPANEMMMIIADPGFKERGGIRGFYAPYQPRIQQGMQVVIDRLPGESAQAFSRRDGDSIGIEMPTVMDRSQHGKTRRGNPHPH